MADGDPLAFFRPKFLVEFFIRARRRRFFTPSAVRRRILAVGPFTEGGSGDADEIKYYLRTVKVRPRKRVVPEGGTFEFQSRPLALATDSTRTKGLATDPQ